MFMWDDFYGEPSEFDMQVEEFKEALRVSVRDEIKQEMEQLRKENESLRAIRDDWDGKVRELEQDYARKESELNKAIRDAASAVDKAKRAHLEQLMEEVAPVAWTVKIEHIKKPKCNLCDALRRRYYITPLGRKAYEDCECAGFIAKYHVKRVPLVRLHTDVRGVLRSFYLICDGDDAYSREECDFFDNTPFEEIKHSSPLFHDENRARRYAAWHNQKAGLK